MGGGDLNMKKSWHPLLLKNQERVWLEEQRALEERKKYEQLKKEKEEERQLQELQRLQEEQTGKKRQEKLEWMYATPATGSSQNPNDLEDYLLGKKRVDKMLIANDNDKLGASHKNFIAVQNANNARDIAAKIREDPLLAIKQQEQAALEALRSNPLRLKQLQEQLGVKPKKDKKERKKDKRSKKERHHRDRDSRSPRRANDEKEDRRPRHLAGSGSRSPSRRRYEDDKYRHRSRSRSADKYRTSGTRPRSRSPRGYREEQDRPRRQSPDYRRGRSSSRTPPSSRERDEPAERRDSVPGKPNFSDERRRPLSPEPQQRYTDKGKRRYSPSPRRRSPSPKRNRVERSPPRVPPPRVADKREEERAARLAAMASNASSMEEERRKRLAVRLEEEKAEAEADARARAKNGGMSSFLSQEAKKVYGGVGGLEDRIRRGKGGMRVDAD